MKQEEQENREESPTPAKTIPAESGSGLDEAQCRCKEAQGKTMTDFLKVMIDDLAFWRKKQKH